MTQNTMQQIIITEPGGPEKLAFEKVAIPEPQANEVLVKVHAFGLNRPDILQRQGLYPMPKGVTPVPGLEVAGEVVAVGADVSQFKVGDAVCGLTNGGGYAEYCVVPESQTLTIPSGVSFVQAAAIPETFFTVWANVFQMGKAKAGETALIHGGTSGIGTTALMLCNALGLKTFATVGSDEKVQAISQLTTAINYKTQDYEQVIKASHCFNLLDARGAISVTERQRYILRVRTLARSIAQSYVAARAKLGFPMAEPALRDEVLAQLKAQVEAEAAQAEKSAESK